MTGSTWRPLPIRISAVGSTVAPSDMLAAARASLSAQALHELLFSTGGAAPTPAQLCAAVEQERITAATALN